MGEGLGQAIGVILNLARPNADRMRRRARWFERRASKAFGKADRLRAQGKATSARRWHLRSKRFAAHAASLRADAEKMG
jgi:hypothetical protein